MDNYDFLSLGLNFLENPSTTADMLYDARLEYFDDMNLEQDVFGIDFFDSSAATWDASDLSDQ